MKLELRTLTFRLRREENDIPRSLVPHRVDERIVGVQDRVTLTFYDGSDDALYVRELFDSVDAAQSKVIGSHVQHDANIDFVETKACSENSTARRFEDRDINRRIRQNNVRGERPRHIALDHHAVAEVGAVCRGE